MSTIARHWPWRRSSQVEKGWRPWSLKRWWLWLVLVVETGLLTTIIVLSILSAKYDGFRPVLVHSIANILTVPLDSSFWWTTVPAILIGIFALAYTDLVTAAANRQPYVELYEGSKAHRSAKLTVLLDYAAHHSIAVWAVALRLRHFHLGAAMFTQLMATLFLVPLMSNLFRSGVAPVIASVEIQVPDGFDISALSAATDLQPAFDISSAMNVYGAAPPVWMQTDRAFEPFYSEKKPISGSATLDTLAYSVETDCRWIPRSDLNTTYVGTSVQDTGSVTIGFLDRGCQVDDLQWAIASSDRMYSRTWWTSCSGSDDPQDRIGICAGIFDQTDKDRLANLTMISCWPKYWSTSAAVSMEFTDQGPIQLGDVEERNASRLTSMSLRQLHSNLVGYRLSRVSGDVNADSLGNIVHFRTQELDPTSKVDGAAYLKSLQVVYGTFFAALVNTRLIQPRQVPLTRYGTLTTTSTKLKIVLPIAYTLVALLGSMTLCTLVIFIHVERTKSILLEEPQGLLGRAMVLCQSDVMPFVEKVKRGPSGRAEATEVRQKAL